MRNSPGLYSVDILSEDRRLIGTLENISVAEGALIDLELPSGKVSGVVLDQAYSRVDDAVVVMTLVDAFDAAINEGRPALSRRTVKTDSVGRFAFEGVPSGKWELRASKDSRQSRSATARIAPGEEPWLSLALQPASSITGQVIDPTGAPIVGAKVIVSLVPSQAHNVPAAVEAVTDRTGWFETLADHPELGPAFFVVASPGVPVTAFREMATQPVRLVVSGASGAARVHIHRSLEWPVDLRRIVLVSQTGGVLPLTLLGQMRLLSTLVEEDKTTITIPRLAVGLWQVVSFPSIGAGLSFLAGNHSDARGADVLSVQPDTTALATIVQ